MRIAFVDYVLDPAKPGLTGLSDLVWDIAARLVDREDEVHVVGPYTTSNVPDQRVKVHRFAIPPIGYRNIAGHLLIVLRAYREVMRIGGIDVIHTPEYVSSAIIASFSRQIPVIFTEPGNIYERIERGNPYDFVTTQVYKAAARVTAAKAAHLIATSEWMKGWWQRTGVPHSRMTIISLGIDSSVFRPVAEAREKLGLSTKRKIILYAARLSRENGLDITLRACAEMKAMVPDFELHVLGEGPEKERYQQLASELGIGRQTVWHGWVDFQQLPAYYSAADVFVFSGSSGGTPRVMLQAMACGCPVVASEIGGITDHVQDGLTGLLFPAGDAKYLADRLAHLLSCDALRRTLGNAGAEYARANVDWNVLIPKIRAVYHQAVGSASRRVLGNG
jgi:glycosyltransferase involved in cell wall biosynthesis